MQVSNAMFINNFFRYLDVFMKRIIVIAALIALLVGCRKNEGPSRGVTVLPIN